MNHNMCPMETSVFNKGKMFNIALVNITQDMEYLEVLLQALTQIQEEENP